MELKHLKHFVAIADDGGISAAARRLGLTQPALSRQVQALEQDLGVTLLDRGARSFALTPAAEALVRLIGRHQRNTNSHLRIALIIAHIDQRLERFGRLLAVCM